MAIDITKENPTGAANMGQAPEGFVVPTNVPKAPTINNPNPSPTPTPSVGSAVPQGASQAEIDAARLNQYKVVDPNQAYKDAYASGISNQQARIDSIKKQYAEQLQADLTAQAPINENSLGRTNALSSLMGLSGSSTSSTRTGVTEQSNANINQGIRTKNQTAQMNALNEIYNRIDDNAAKMAAAQLETNKENQKQLLTDTAKSALGVVQSLAQAYGNVNYDTLVASHKDDASFKANLDAAKASGMTDYDIKEAYNKALPPESKPIVGEWIQSKGADGNMMMTRSTFDPITKKSSQESYSTGIPYTDMAKGTVQKLDGGGTIMIYPDGTFKDVKLQTPEEKAAVDLALAKTRADINQSNASAAASYASAANSKASADKTKAELAGTNLGAKATADQLTLLNNSLANAKKLSGASGRSAARKKVEEYTVGATEYTDLVAETNTLRTNVMTLATDPNIKKFFGPQMSNADIQLMTAAGTTLNPELQTPAAMKEELERLEKVITKLNRVANVAAQTENNNAQQPNQVVYNGKTYNVDSSGNMTEVK